MRDRFTVLVGIIAIACGLLWMVGLAADVDVPWEWVLPASLVAVGLLLVLAGRGGDAGPPPSQFEREDTPRVP